MQERRRQRMHESGYSLGEMLAALIIGTMVLTAILMIYSRANHAADAVLGKIERPALATEVLQCLADDFERVLGSGQDVSIQIKNGYDNGFAKAELVIRRTVRDGKNEESTFEEITWRAGYDYGGPAPGLVLYRAHEGINVEDKLFDAKRQTWERNYPLVPICRGVTFFRLEVARGDEFVQEWSEPASLPPGVRITLSFARPYETVRGTWDVDDEEKTIRTIAVDRTRKIRFIVPTEEQGVNPNLSAGERTLSEPPDERTPQGAGTRTPPRNVERPFRRTDGQLPQRTRRR